MSQLILEPNICDADAFYAALTDAHRDLDCDQSERLNARLILLLANHIGNLDALKEALTIASDLGATSDFKNREQENPQ